jgi:uncharacterized membrane protein YccC
MVANISQFVTSTYNDVKAMRILRFAFGVTAACGFAYGINWPLAFLMPMFTAMILAMPLPKPSVKVSLNNMLTTLLAFAIGLVFSLFFSTISYCLFNCTCLGSIPLILLFKSRRLLLVYLDVDNSHFNFTHDC